MAKEEGETPKEREEEVGHYVVLLNLSLSRLCRVAQLLVALSLLCRLTTHHLACTASLDQLIASHILACYLPSPLSSHHLKKPLSEMFHLCQQAQYQFLNHATIIVEPSNPLKISRYCHGIKLLNHCTNIASLILQVFSFYFYGHYIYIYILHSCDNSY